MLSVVLFSVKGGIETYTLQLANALASHARVAYAVDDRTSSEEEIYSLIDPRVTLIKFRRPRRREVWGVAEMYRLSQKIKKFQPDVFHLQSDGVWESVLLRFLPGIPVINTVHDPIKHIDQRSWLNNWTMRDAIGKSTGWVVHSEGLKEILVNKNQVIPDRILIHPLGIYDIYQKIATQGGSREKYILFFGAWRVNKGLDLFLEAIDRVKDQIPDWRIVIAGRGTLKDKSLLERNKDRMTLYNRYVTDSETAALFAGAGIAVLPYRHGSQSAVLALAAAFSCPVLATRVGNIPEMLVNKQHALLVEPESVEALANGLLEIAANDQLRAKLGHNLAEHARANWSWDKIAEKTVRFYRQCL